MPLRVLNEGHTPLGGWTFRHKDPDRFDTGTILHELVERSEDWMLAQGLDASLAYGIVHETTAKRLVSAGRSDLVGNPDEPPSRTLAQYGAGAKALMLKWWRESSIKGILKGKFERGESVLVDQEEADRRAAICVGCPQNVLPTGPEWRKNWAGGIMLDSVMGRKTASHEKLGVCGVCSCELRAACWWPADILAAATPKNLRDKFPPANRCWKAAVLS